MEEAIAKAASEDHKRIREVHLLLGDIGLLARSVKTGEFREASLEKLRPTNFMLAEPMSSAEEIWNYFQRELYAEYKYDGVRAQVHKSGAQVRIFSRRLEDISASFPEVVESVKKIRHDLILDGEIVAFSDGKPLPFQLLQRRLRSLQAPTGIPVQYFCFDVLLLDDDNQLYKQPLKVRKERLAATLAGTSLPLVVGEVVGSAKQIQEFFRVSRSLGYEGLVLKEPESPYTPGRRGRYWAKLKEELDTIDAVIVAAEYGHGKRAGVISDYTFAVKEGKSLKVIGKAYSGLTDEEIDTMTSRLKAITLVDHGFRREVKPEIVLEVAFDSIQKSGRHDSGFALRFPRIKRIREDKSVEDVDTIEKVREIFDSQKIRLDER
jgi:DNA ligase-1